MTSNRQEIDDLKADIQQSKQELASAGDAVQVDFHRKRLLQLENQLSSLREQQTILLQSNQQSFPLSDRQADQQRVTNQAADQVVEALHSHGFAWLKVSKSEMRSFHRLRWYTSGPDSCFDQAGRVLEDKRLVQYNTGTPSSRLPPAMCTAADRVSAPDPASCIYCSTYAPLLLSQQLDLFVGMQVDGPSCPTDPGGYIQITLPWSDFQ